MAKSNSVNVESFSVGGGAFSFEGAAIGELGASGYGVGCVGIDLTGSVDGFQNQLHQMAVEIVKSCASTKNPFSSNMLLRTFTFNSDTDIVELHGFIPVKDIDTSSYPNFVPGGTTPLIDAGYSAAASVIEYAKNLAQNDFTCNGVAFLVTDGGENASRSATLKSLKKLIDDAKENKSLLSFELVVIGINTSQCRRELESFCKSVGAKFIDAGDVTPGKLAHIGGFVSQSFSASSQAAAAGQPSQPVDATI